MKRAYDVATPRVRQYLDAEVEHVLKFISPGDVVLELGCGYGRILPALAAKTRGVVGLDTSWASLELARETLADACNVRLTAADAVELPFEDAVFDLVVCIQNGISAFHVNQRALIDETIRVTKTGGTALFSSYSDEFWEDRLEWFELQAGAGLLGEIDYEKTSDGTIVCKDGFTATTVDASEFRALTAGLDADTNITEVDGSSVFCEITPS
ncbi:MAG: class I SAM-dependent methyltransferase [Candidatus Coatesbacteria bacterium]|nr:MAG: class I SAM-dependent methyltransferase [Candidatus Coatesbacteria bacterium]